MIFNFDKFDKFDKLSELILLLKTKKQYYSLRLKRSADFGR